VDAEAWQGFVRDYDRYNTGDHKMPFSELRQSLAAVIDSAARGAQAGDGREARAKLARFGALVLQSHRGPSCEVGDVDGGTLQEHAVAAGVIEPRTVTEPCSECCVCAPDFPTECYFTAPDVLAVLRSEQG
jgi:hypothetical protein